MEKKRKIGLLIIIALIISAFPIIIAVMVSLPILKCMSNENDWIGFWGSYAGTISSMIIPIALFYMQRSEDRKQAVLPVINAYQKNGMIKKQKEPDMKIDYLWYNDCLKGWVLEDKRNAKIRQEVNDKTKWLSTELFVTNIGSGPIMNLRVYVEGKEKKESKYEISIASGETALYKIYVEAERLNVRENNKLIFHFSDVYKKEYKQDIAFGITNNGIEWSITDFCELSELKEKG